MLGVARLAVDRWTLHTGGAPGADQAFHPGAASGNGAIELHLPWPAFEAEAFRRTRQGARRLVRPAPGAYEIVARNHPTWSALTAAAGTCRPNLEVADPSALRDLLDPGRQHRRPGTPHRRDRPGAAHRGRTRHRRLQPRAPRP
jgi:hypothetical protein